MKIIYHLIHPVQKIILCNTIGYNRFLCFVLSPVHTASSESSDVTVYSVEADTAPPSSENQMVSVHDDARDCLLLQPALWPPSTNRSTGLQYNSHGAKCQIGPRTDFRKTRKKRRGKATNKTVTRLANDSTA